MWTEGWNPAPTESCVVGGACSVAGSPHGRSLHHWLESHVNGV